MVESTVRREKKSFNFNRIYIKPYLSKEKVHHTHFNTTNFIFESFFRHIYAEKKFFLQYSQTNLLLIKDYNKIKISLLKLLFNVDYRMLKINQITGLIEK